MTNIAIPQVLSGLAEEELTVLQMAALLEDRFQLEHLLELTSLKPSKVLQLLRKMVQKNIIAEKSGMDEARYSFVREEFLTAVLNSLEDEKRKLLLQRIVSYLAKELPQDENKSLILAKLHLKLGKKNRNFFHYTKEAADLLASAQKGSEALELYDEIIKSFSGEDSGSSPETAMFINSVISYVPIAANLRPAETIFPVILKAKSAAENVHSARGLTALELCLGRLYQRQGNIVRAFKHYNEGRTLAQRAGDKVLLRSASRLSALTLFWQGRMIEAIQVYERILGEVEEISSDLGEMSAYLMLGLCYGLTGRINRGLSLAEAVKEKAVKRGNLKAQSFADAVMALILLETRQVEKAGPYIDSAIEIGEKIGDDVVLTMTKPCKAYEIYSQGNLEGAQEALASAMGHAKAIGQGHLPAPFVFEILWSLHEAKCPAVNGYSFRSEIRGILDWPNIYMKGVALRYDALDKRREGERFEVTQEILEESERLLQEAGADIELGRTQVELAKLLLDKEDTEGAGNIAQKAYRTLSKIDRSLFASELLSIIRDKPKEDRIFQGLEAVSRLVSETDFQLDAARYLGRIATLVCDMFGAERSAILLTKGEASGDAWKTIASRNFGTADLEEVMRSPVRDFIMAANEKKEAVIVSDVVNNTSLLRRTTSNSRIKSAICIPLLADSRTIGLIYADNRILEGVFSERDRIIMTAVASQVALLLESMRLSRELQDFRWVCGENAPLPEESALLEGFHEIVGKSKGIRSCLARARKVSATDTTVLIYGETGVGKGLVARAVHQHSNRSEKPFLTVDVSALTETLLTSELFGHEKGAFTSAERTRIGRFEMADQGTVFLDEIGDLSKEGQVKLLRVLQEGEFERVGGMKTIHSDFRLIVATNRNLAQMVASGEFRSDLFYRINTFSIQIPPLRERKEDIPELALFFLRKYGKKHHREDRKIPNSEMKKLLAYAWPGNVRELEHIIEMSIIVSDRANLTIPDLNEPRPVALEEGVGAGTELLLLEDIERKHITRVLESTKWRLRGERGAAKILGLKPSTLEFRMKKLGIKR